MKKVLSFVLVLLVMCTALVGCKGTGRVLYTPYETPENRAAFAKNMTEFEENIGKLVDISLYSSTDYQEDGYVYYSHSKNVDTELSYTVKFPSGGSITLPVTHSQLVENGWSTEIEEDLELSVSKITKKSVPYTNEKGEKITLWVTKSTEGDSDEKILLKDCRFFEIDIVLNEQKINYNDEFEVESVDGFKKADGAAKFNICDGIKHNSTIKEVIDKLGMPYAFEYDYVENTVDLRYHQKVGEYYASLVLEFSSLGNYISEVSLECSISDIRK